jgi:hypothetical protein
MSDAFHFLPFGSALFRAVSSTDESISFPQCASRGTAEWWMMQVQP